MSSSGGGLTSLSAGGPNRASMRPSTKAVSSAVRPSPSRPHPKCFSRGSVIAFPPAFLGFVAQYSCGADLTSAIHRPLAVREHRHPPLGHRLDALLEVIGFAQPVLLLEL